MKRGLWDFKRRYTPWVALYNKVEMGRFGARYDMTVLKGRRAHVYSSCFAACVDGSAPEALYGRVECGFTVLSHVRLYVPLLFITIVSGRIVALCENSSIS